MTTEYVDNYDKMRAKVAEILKANGIEYTAEFVPMSASRNAGEKNLTLNWKVTLSKGSASLTTDYSAGIAHVPGYNKIRRPDTVHNNDYLKLVVESGKYSALPDNTLPNRRIPAPDVTDIIHSLLLDSDVLNASGFEEWASDFGYDTDSRKAESIYRACLEIALKLRRLIPDDVAATLRKTLQDY